MISYTPFWSTLSAKGLSQYELLRRYHLSAGTLDSIRRGRGISTRTIDRLCAVLDCSVSDVIVYVPDQDLLLRPRIPKA